MMLPQNNHTLGTINGSYGQLVNRWMVGGIKAPLLSLSSKNKYESIQIILIET